MNEMLTCVGGVAGLALLYFGADWLVRGGDAPVAASRRARAARAHGRCGLLAVYGGYLVWLVRTM